MLRKLFVSALAAAAAGMGLIAMAGPAGANNVARNQTVFATNMVSAGYGGMRGGDGTGTLTVAGVSGTVTKALLYWHGPTNSTDPAANAAVSLAGHAVTGTNIGVSEANCWPYANSQAYRADVTGLVAGNGSYALAGFVKPDANINGVSLLVFFDDGNASNNRDIVLFDGNDSTNPNPNDADGWNVTLAGINYSTGSANMTLHVADGQRFPDGAIDVNGTTVAPAGELFDGDSVPVGPTADSTNGGLWDIKPFDVTSVLHPGANTLALTSAQNGDCLSLVVAAVDLPAGAAPDQPACVANGLQGPAKPTLAKQLYDSTLKGLGLVKDPKKNGALSAPVGNALKAADPVGHEVACAVSLVDSK
jgi:hypothetical protein